MTRLQITLYPAIAARRVIPSQPQLSHIAHNVRRQIESQRNILVPHSVDYEAGDGRNISLLRVLNLAFYFECESYSQHHSSYIPYLHRECIFEDK